MMILRHYITILFLMGWGWNSFAVKIEKKLLYSGDAALVLQHGYL